MRNFFITKEWENHQYQKMVSRCEALNEANAENTVVRQMTPEEREQVEKAIEQDRQYYKERPENGRKERLNRAFKNRRNTY